MTIESLKPGAQMAGAQISSDMLPPGTPDPEAVELLRLELLRASMGGSASAQSGKNPQGLSTADSEATEGMLGTARTLGGLLSSARRIASDLSNTLQHGDAITNEIKSESEKDRSKDGSRDTLFNRRTLQKLRDLQEVNSVAFVTLDLISKTVGKAVYTVDSLSRN